MQTQIKLREKIDHNSTRYHSQGLVDTRDRLSELCRSPSPSYCRVLFAKGMLAVRFYIKSYIKVETRSR